MPSASDNNSNSGANNLSIKSLQLITPRPLPTRAQPFSTTIALIDDQEFLVYPHQKSIYLVNTAQPQARLEIRHTATVTCVSVSPRHEFILAGDCNGKLRSWSLSPANLFHDGKEWQVLCGAVRCILFRDEETFFASGEGREYFAVAVTGDKVMPLSGPTKPCPTLCLTGQPGTQHLVIGSSDSTCTVYDLSAPFPRQSPRFIKTLTGVHTNGVLCSAGQEGGFITGGADGHLVAYTLPDFEVIAKEKCHNGAILASQLSSDSIFTASTDGFLARWNLSNLQKQSQSDATCIPTPGGQACSLAVGREAVFLTRLSGQIERFEASSLKAAGFLSCGHAKGITSISSSAPHHLQSESYDGQVLHWQLKSSQLHQVPSAEIVTGAGVGDGAKNPSIPPNAHVIASSANFTAWSDTSHSIHLAEKRVSWCHHSARVDALSWMIKRGHEPVLLSGGVDGHLMAWRVDREREPVGAVRLAHAGPITGLAVVVEEEGIFASAGQDGLIRLWQLV